MSDIVLQADRFQSIPDDQRKALGLEPAVRCPRHQTKLWPKAGGSAMACVSKETPQATCGYEIGIDHALMATAPR